MGLPEWAVSRQDAAKRLGIHVMTLDRAIKRGEILAVRYCSRTMVPVWELLRLLAVPDREVQRHLSSAQAWQADRQREP